MRAKVRNHCRQCGKRIPSGLHKCLACSLNLKSKSPQSCKCLVCGSALGARSEVCSTCGTNFLESAEEEAGIRSKSSEEFICMICWHQVNKNARRCRICGTLFVEGSDSYSGPIVERVVSGRSTPNPG